MCFFFRLDWMYDYQGMVIMAANQVWWTWEVEDVFRKVKKGDKMGMKDYAKKLHSQIDDLVFQVRPPYLHSRSFFLGKHLHNLGLFPPLGSLSAQHERQEEIQHCIDC